MVNRSRARAALVWATAALLLAPAAPARAAQPRTWNFDQVRVPVAQPAGRNGDGVVVAVIDTWVDRSHPNFGGRVLPGVNCIGGCGSSSYTRDRCEHGTHVAGTVASASYGVAPKAKVLPLRVLAWDESDKECTGTSTDVADAIRYAISHGVHVVNLSLGAQVPLVGRDADMVRAVEEAAAAGIVVVFAAGNAGLPVADDYGDAALIVAATDRSGRIPSYSQRGAGVDLAAPGGDAPDGTCTIPDCVISTWPGTPGDPEQYAALAGTSMAAPHVAGVAALLFAQRPGRGRADVVDRLRSTARSLSGAGDGLIDATAALGARPAARPSPTASRPPARQPDRSVRPAEVPAARTPVARRTPVASPTPRRSTPAPTPSPAEAELRQATPGPQTLPLTATDDAAAPVAFALALIALVSAGHLLAYAHRSRHVYRVT